MDNDGLDISVYAEGPNVGYEIMGARSGRTLIRGIMTPKEARDLAQVYIEIADEADRALPGFPDFSL